MADQGNADQEGKALPALPVPPARLPNIVGESPPMQQVYAAMRQVAATNATVCVCGESGTGKELVATAIHRLSQRREGPFVVFDSAAVPDGLAESEMFGHERGSFTGAVASRRGVFELADGGTLFLDEVGELSIPVQAKILRVVQSREFRRVGGTRPLKVNVRLIAATNRDIPKMVAAGLFREDLLYRLMVIPVTLPPLRERREDIPLLVDHFLGRFNRQGGKQVKGVSAEALSFLLRYEWPGNVRELENCIERAAVTAAGAVIERGDIKPIPREAPNGNGANAFHYTRHGSAQLPPCLADVERDYILRVLDFTYGNRSKAAQLLGISSHSVRRKIAQYQQEGFAIPPPLFTCRREKTAGSNGSEDGSNDG